MMSKRQEKIREKYQWKTQYIIDVINSCKTEDQLSVCFEWANRVTKDWRRFETSEEEWFGCRHVLDVIDAINNLIDQIAFAYNLKFDRLLEDDGTGTTD